MKWVTLRKENIQKLVPSWKSLLIPDTDHSQNSVELSIADIAEPLISYFVLVVAQTDFLPITFLGIISKVMGE